MEWSVLILVAASNNLLVSYPDLSFQFPPEARLSTFALLDTLSHDVNIFVAIIKLSFNPYKPHIRDYHVNCMPLKDLWVYY